MAIGAKKVRLLIQFKSDEEARAWTSFAAAAGVSLCGDADTPGEDAKDAADFADEMLRRYRERQE